MHAPHFQNFSSVLSIKLIPPVKFPGAYIKKQQQLCYFKCRAPLSYFPQACKLSLTLPVNNEMKFYWK